MNRFVLLPLVALLLIAPPLAAAESDAVIAARLAGDAKELMDAGRCDEALPKLDASLTLYAHPKTKFFKAKCLLALDRDLAVARTLLEEAKEDPALEQYSAELPDVLLAVEKRLQPVPLVVTVEGGGEGEVRIDGAVVGRAPYRGRVERGRHEVSVIGPGCDTAPRSVRAVGDEPILVTVRCVPPPPAKLALKAPEGTRVSVDGVARGRTPLAGPIEVEAGPHTVVFAPRDGEVVRRTLTLAAGEHVVVDAGLADEGGESAAWAWTTLGTGVALVGVGSAFLIQHGIDYADKREASATWSGDTISDTNLIVGGVTAGVGVGLVVTSFFLWPDDDEATARLPGEVLPGLALEAGPAGATIGYTGRF